MGQHADDIIDGVVCEWCGEFFDDIIDGGDGPGYPRRCNACEPKGAASGGSPPGTESQQAVRRAKNKRKRDRQRAKRVAAQQGANP